MYALHILGKKATLASWGGHGPIAPPHKSAYATPDRQIGRQDEKRIMGPKGRLQI